MFTNMININNNQYRVTFAKLSCKHHPGGEEREGEGRGAETERMERERRTRGKKKGLAGKSRL